MRISRLAAFQIVACGLALSACRTGVPGHYELDVEQTKICVAKSALDNPDDAEMKEGTIKLMDATRLDMLLDESGMMTSTTVVTGPGSPAPQTRDGTWKLDGKRVVIKVTGVADTLCEIDGKRLRCQKPSPGTLYSNYVLVKK